MTLAYFSNKSPGDKKTNSRRQSRWLMCLRQGWSLCRERCCWLSLEWRPLEYRTRCICLSAQPSSVHCDTPAHVRWITHCRINQQANKATALGPQHNSALNNAKVTFLIGTAVQLRLFFEHSFSRTPKFVYQLTKRLRPQTTYCGIVPGSHWRPPTVMYVALGNNYCGKHCHQYVVLWCTRYRDRQWNVPLLSGTIRYCVLRSQLVSMQQRRGLWDSRDEQRSQEREQQICKHWQFKPEPQLLTV